jgi:GT2 family glycosyltransferase
MVGILLVLFGNHTNISRLSNAIRNQTFKAYKVYAIDNLPENACWEFLQKELPSTKFSPSMGNIGFAKGNNVLAEEAVQEGCNYLWVLNPDMEPEPNALEYLVDFMENNSDIGLVGPLLLRGNSKSNSKIQLFGSHVNFKTQEKKSLYADAILSQTPLPDELRVDMINAGSLLIRSEFIRNNYLFEERYFMYNDEIDIARRIKDKGFSIAVISKARIWHHHDWSKINKCGYNMMYYYMMRNKMLYYYKFKLPLRCLLELFKQLFLSPVVLRFCLRTSSISMFRFYYLGLLHGFLGISGKAKINFG